MNEQFLIGGFITLAVLWIVFERIFDHMPASHWINQVRDRFSSDGSTDVGGDWGDDGGGCGD